MKLKNILITVDDIEEAKKFYHDFFGLDVLLDSDDNVIPDGRPCPAGAENVGKLSAAGGIYCRRIMPASCTLRSVTLRRLHEKLKELYPSIHYLNLLTTYSWGQKRYCASTTRPET